MLSDKELEVLRLIEEDGIEAKLTPAQREIRESLESARLIYYLGDEYDANYYVSTEGKTELNKTDPAWWKAEYQQWLNAVRHAEQQTANILSASVRRVNAWNQQIEDLQTQILQEKEQLPQRLEEAKSQADELKAQLEAWAEENKEHLND